MELNIISFDTLLAKLRQKRSIEENLSLIVQNMEKEIVYGSFGVFLKVVKSNIFRLTNGSNLSSDFTKNTIFTVGDPLIAELMNFQKLDIKGPSQYFFEKDYSHLIISPIFLHEDLMGFLFIDKETGHFDDIEIAKLGVYTSLISFVVAIDSQITLIDQHKEIYESTRIYHPAAFKENAEITFAVMQRYNRYLSVVIMKLANHKNILRTFGEKKTDEMMSNISTLLQKSLRNSDIIGKMNNDTFAILLPETSAKNSLQTIQRINETITKHDFMKSSSLGWGISSKTDDTVSFNILLKTAEDAANKSTRKKNKQIIVA